MSNILDPSFRWTGSLSTNIRDRFKRAGFTPPEQVAVEAEEQARYEGALRAMLKIQSESPVATVTRIDERRRRR